MCVNMLLSVLVWCLMINYIKSVCINIDPLQRLHTDCSDIYDDKIKCLQFPACSWIDFYGGLTWTEHTYEPYPKQRQNHNLQTKLQNKYHAGDLKLQTALKQLNLLKITPNGETDIKNYEYKELLVDQTSILTAYATLVAFSKERKVLMSASTKLTEPDVPNYPISGDKLPTFNDFRGLSRQKKWTEKHGKWEEIDNREPYDANDKKYDLKAKKDKKNSKRDKDHKDKDKIRREHESIGAIFRYHGEKWIGYGSAWLISPHFIFTVAHNFVDMEIADDSFTFKEMEPVHDLKFFANFGQDLANKEAPHGTGNVNIPQKPGEHQQNPQGMKHHM